MPAYMTFNDLTSLCVGERPKTRLALSVLNPPLLGTASAALEKPLVESGLGASTTGGGYSNSLQQATFAVGLKGVGLGEAAKAEATRLEQPTLEPLTQ